MGVQIASSYSRIPFKLLEAEAPDSNILAEMQEISLFYEVYEKGADFTVEGDKGDYKPADLRFKTARTLVDKQARFMFSRTPDFLIDVAEEDGSQIDNTILQNLVSKVMEANRVSKKLLQASKDCFIGKRVAVILNFNDSGISVKFASSLEFLYEVDPTNIDKITKIVVLSTLNTAKQQKAQRIYKKKYWLKNNICMVEEAIYDGLGALVEQVIKPTKTLFTYIPAAVIINDGLTGDLEGESEIGQLMDSESWHSKLSNGDMDAERKGMNPVKYAVDMSPESTKNLSSSAGSFWDLQTDQNAAESASSKVGVLESSMGYSAALTSTLDRIKNAMHEQVDVPNIVDAQAQLSSGKALKAIYWGLLVRCDEKMISWRPILEFICRAIIDGALLYPNSAIIYVEDTIPDVVFTVAVDNQYPLPEDEIEGKQMDLSEVAAQTMSRKTYMRKWRGLTDEEADSELEQIALERQILEDSFAGMEGAAGAEEEMIDEEMTSEQDAADITAMLTDETADNEIVAAIEDDPEEDDGIDALLKELDDLEKEL